jgi:hypothetical protein
MTAGGVENTRPHKLLSNPVVVDAENTISRGCYMTDSGGSYSPNDWGYS